MPGIYVQKSGPRGDYMELTGWEGTAGTAVIPSHVRDLPVTKIASHAFESSACRIRSYRSELSVSITAGA